MLRNNSEKRAPRSRTTRITRRAPDPPPSQCGSQLLKVLSARQGDVKYSRRFRHSANRENEIQLALLLSLSLLSFFLFLACSVFILSEGGRNIFPIAARGSTLRGPEAVRASFIRSDETRRRGIYIL